jgi:hypothetical protein
VSPKIFETFFFQNIIFLFLPRNALARAETAPRRRSVRDPRPGTTDP